VQGLLTRTIVVTIEGYEGNLLEPNNLDHGLCILKNGRKNYGVPSAPCTEKELPGFGAHVIVMYTDGVGQVQGVKLHHVGQTNVMAGVLSISLSPVRTMKGRLFLDVAYISHLI
jgi:hypothetical protein